MAFGSINRPSLTGFLQGQPASRANFREGELWVMTSVETWGYFQEVPPGLRITQEFNASALPGPAVAAPHGMPCSLPQL